MRVSAPVTAYLLAAVLAAAAATVSCSSGGPSLPAGPAAAGKAVVREQAVDGEGSGIAGAEVFVDGEPAGTLTDGDGFFTVTLDPGPHLLEARESGETLWSKEVLVEEEGEEAPPDGDGEVGEDGGDGGDFPGIGRCVSECTHIYNPAKRDPLADDLFEGPFNARYCVEFCRETGYPGGHSPEDDGLCNPFYQGSDPDCGGDGEPPEGQEGTGGTTVEESAGDGKPGNGRGRPDKI